MRICHPLTVAALRWSYHCPDLRKDANEELCRVVPWIAFKICDEGANTPTPKLCGSIRSTLGLGEAALPDQVRNMLQRVFN